MFGWTVPLKKEQFSHMWVKQVCGLFVSHVWLNWFWISPHTHLCKCVIIDSCGVWMCALKSQLNEFMWSHNTHTSLLMSHSRCNIMCVYAVCSICSTAMLCFLSLSLCACVCFVYFVLAWWVCMLCRCREEDEDEALLTESSSDDDDDEMNCSSCVIRYSSAGVSERTCAHLQ